MKKLIFFSTIITTLFACDNVPQKKAGDKAFDVKRVTTGELEFTTKKIDFGNVSNDTTVTADFTFKNSGTDSVKIIGVEPDCECTSSSLSKQVVLPDDTASIKLKVNTHGKKGVVALYSTILANTKTKLYLLKISMNVEK